MGKHTQAKKVVILVEVFSIDTDYIIMGEYVHFTRSRISSPNRSLSAT